MKPALALAFACVQRPVGKQGHSPVLAAKRVVWTFALALIAITNCLEIARAQPSPNIQIASEPQLPDDRPTRRKPMGTRGPCEETTGTPFTPLLPINKSGFSGFTLTGHPTFWFYVPYKTSSVRSGKFTLSLEGQPNNQVYQTDLKLPETPGFVSVTLPTTAKPLEKNQQYRWKFRLYCASDDPSLSVSHTGTVERVDLPGLETQLKTATLAQRINLYIQNRIWYYDASTDLAKIHDLPQAWLNLLKAMGLQQLTQEPIAGSVVLSNRRN